MRRFPSCLPVPPQPPSSLAHDTWGTSPPAVRIELSPIDSLLTACRRESWVHGCTVTPSLFLWLLLRPFSLLARLPRAPRRIHPQIPLPRPQRPKQRRQLRRRRRRQRPNPRREITNSRRQGIISSRVSTNRRHRPRLVRIQVSISTTASTFAEVSAAALLARPSP